MRPPTYRLTEGDIYAAMKLAWRAQMMSAKGFFFTLISPVLPAVAVYALGIGGDLSGIVDPVVFLVVFFGVFWSLRRVARTESRTAHNQVDNSFDWAPDGFAIWSEKASNRLRWEDLHGYASDRNVLIMFVSRRAFLTVPRRVFTDDQFAEVTTAIAAAGVANWARWH